MASRPNIVPQQTRGEVAGGGGATQHNKKARAAADVRNRRALGDIGNFVTIRGNEGKPQTQITCPITRSFCAQLLANAQAAAAAVKKQGCVNVDTATLVHDGIPVGCKKVMVPKPAAVFVHKKVTIKSQSPEPMEISPDIEPVPEANKVSKIEKVVLVNEKKDGDVSAAKKKSHTHTLTSVLTARSKAACGVANNKSNKHIVDIDANNDLAGVEYVEDIYKFYKLVENECRPHSYMHSQTEINEKMRAILIDWLTDVHQKFELSPETLYLTINIIDRFLSVKIVPRRELQLVGMGAMLIASKYEQIWALEVNDLVCIADRAYAHTQILSMEKTILGKLEWNLTVPTHYVFLVRFIKASVADEEEVSKQQQMENMVYFLADLGMMHYDTIMFCPSMVAASAVYAARCTLNKSPAWTDTLKLHTSFGEKQLMDCAKLLAFFHSKAAESKLQVVFRKYSNSLRGAVALIPPAKRLLSGDASSETMKEEQQASLTQAVLLISYF